MQVTADILEAAEEGVKQLAGARGEHHHFNLQYVESAKTQVQMPVTGTVLKDRWTAFYASMHCIGHQDDICIMLMKMVTGTSCLEA